MIYNLNLQIWIAVSLLCNKLTASSLVSNRQLEKPQILPGISTCRLTALHALAFLAASLYEFIVELYNSG